MRRRSLWVVAVLGVMGGCAYPTYSVDEDLDGPDLDPAPDTCRGDLDGPALVPVLGGYCIDSTEVTWGDYELWLGAALVDPPTQTGACSENDLTMDQRFVPTGTGYQDLPVVGVDWCDAYAYCQGVGKELCGMIGGEENPFGAYRDAESSQWYNACSSGGVHTYPYGDEYESGTCYTESEFDGSVEITSVPVGVRDQCQSSELDYGGVFDLSGNVEEWENSCDTSLGCRARGGAARYSQTTEGVGADRCASTIYHGPTTRLDYLGFRCCYTP
jgi:formylglycine-generating enzyme